MKFRITMPRTVIFSATVKCCSPETADREIGTAIATMSKCFRETLAQLAANQGYTIEYPSARLEIVVTEERPCNRVGERLPGDQG